MDQKWFRASPASGSASWGGGGDLSDFSWKSSWTFFEVSRKSMTESRGLPEVQLESTLCNFSRFTLDLHRGQYRLGSCYPHLIGIDLVVECDFSPTIAFDHPQSQPGIAAESGGIVPTKSGVSLGNTVWLFRDALTLSEVNTDVSDVILQHWPSLMSWSALTLSKVRCNLL